MGKYIDKILDRPIISTIAFIALDFIIMAVFIVLFEKILKFIIPSISNVVINSLATIIVTIIFLFIYRRYMRDKLQNFISTKNLKFAFILLIPSVIILIYNILNNVIVGNFEFNYIVIIAGIAPGFIEELVFRGFIISNLMRIRKSKKVNIYLIVALSALPFGLFHLLNIISGANVSYSIAQAFFTICLGVFFAAIYLRTGNLIGTIIVHVLMDITALTDSNLIGPNIAGVVSQVPTLFEIVIIFVISIFVLALGLYYIRKNKWKDIDKTWDEIVIE